MKWTTAADFDLAAAYEGKDGKQGLVYFCELGDLNSFPFLQLSADEGVDDSGGDNEETMRITKLDERRDISKSANYFLGDLKHPGKIL